MKRLKNLSYLLLSIGTLLMICGTFMGVTKLFQEVKHNRESIQVNEMKLNMLIKTDSMHEFIIKESRTDDSIKIDILKENNRILKLLNKKLN